MGTITVYQHHSIGGNSSVDGSPVYNLGSLTARTQDATTSTTAESITLRDDTNYVRIVGAELHRVCLGSNTLTTVYEEIPASSDAPLGRDFAVKGGETLYYRLDA